MSLELRNVSLKQGQDSIIDDVSLLFERGTMNVLLGPTLAGKTTLMRLMAGLDKPTSGDVLVDGVSVLQVPVRRRSVAMVYQQFVNYPSLTVYENIASPLRVAGLPKAEIEKRVADASRVLRLDPFLKRLPAQLSGGQQQRTAIARALVKHAELVLLDEPLANLDYKLREELREELPKLFAATGTILVYATTEPTEALLLGGTTATLWQGRVTQVGPTPSVYRSPANIDAARVFSDPPLNEFTTTLSGPRATLPRGGDIDAQSLLPNLPDGIYRIGFRVEDAKLGTVSGAPLAFPGQVAVTEISGSESFVHLDIGSGTWVSLVLGVHDWKPGAPAEIRIDPARIFVFDEGGRLVRAPEARIARTSALV
ncbi:ABC transporter ATP-binding protein [Acidisoma silvae]|uniref:ABC transporter ATP-binding protein n=1 Tax=Acidisoma silvae TaxID=2802396 RepID=A0A963YNK8_9PROT|nr:ABC transporter ATP-binding protein [Acidisoma silvae]MCB8874151.1 ABC transporter ATP-binding protein [Acidisoma silvae]